MAIDYEAIVEAYIDNADYASVDSLAKAKLFRTACIKLLVVPEEMYRQHERLRFAPRAEAITLAKKEVDGWIAAKSIGATTDQYVDFTGYRD